MKLGPLSEGKVELNDDGTDCEAAEEEEREENDGEEAENEEAENGGVERGVAAETVGGG